MMRKLVGIISGILTVSLSTWNLPACAGDPFRLNNPREIGQQTEAAFLAIFAEGNYPEAKAYLLKAEAEADPLTYAMRASLAYTEKDWETLRIYALKTIEVAEQLKATDPLRGNLYLAVGHFLEGTYDYMQTEDVVGALTKLTEVFQYLEKAEKEDAQDPELNLLKGYMDLMLAVNLPFASAEEAIDRLASYGAPDYLVSRGIAVAYRDLDEYDQALAFVNQSLALTPNNPEIFYLKAQILRSIGKKQESLETLNAALNYFDQALDKSEQLPESILKALRYERGKTAQEIQQFQSSR